MNPTAIRKIETIHQKYRSSSFRDPLTGLFAQDFFMLYIDQEIQRQNRYGSTFSLALVDIDDFSLYNQEYGAEHGNKLLKRLGWAIQENIRGADIAAHYVGDQFAILFVNTEANSAMIAAEHLRKAIETDSNGKITVSIGLAASTGNIQNGPEKVFQEAFSALGQAKIDGKNRVFLNHHTEAQASRSSKPTILIVDDDPLNRKLLNGLLKPLGYSTRLSSNGVQALECLGEVDIDLVLLDIMMPDMDGFEVCRTIKGCEDTRQIPVVLITALDDVDTKVRGIEAGADDFLTKPPHKAELIARVKSLLRIKQLNGSLTSIENVLFSMARAVEAKDRYTQGHVDRVSRLAFSIGKRMGLSERELDALRLGGALHDIGKMGIPGEILNKPGALNDQEWTIMKTHPEIGYDICFPLKKNLGHALDIVRHHHEKLDGSGYPDGLKGDEILMVTRIMAVADIFDALTSDRPYRKAMSNGKALEILAAEARDGKNDTTVTCYLTELVADGESLGVGDCEAVQAESHLCCTQE